MFLPSYSLLRKCERVWNPNHFVRQKHPWGSQLNEVDAGPSVWDRLIHAKHNVVVEPSGGQEDFEEKKREYMETVRTKGGCVLLAVYRGKMSEGISFNDHFARGVVCVGLPLPSAFALPIKQKMNYNDEQRKLQNRTDLLPGQEWYSHQAYRAIAQALGRCIRHSADYGAVFLLDIRHCDDSSPNGGIPQAHINLPKWMRKTVKNLSKHTTGGSSMLRYISATNSILGGWSGLKNELELFFRNAKTHAHEVLAQQHEKTADARNNSLVQNFDLRTNRWSENNNMSTPSPIILDNSPVHSYAAINSTSTPQEHRTNISSIDFVKPSLEPCCKSSSKKYSTIQELFRKQQQRHEDQEKLEGSEHSPADLESDPRLSTTPSKNSTSINSIPRADNVLHPSTDEAGGISKPDEDERRPAADYHPAKQACRTEDEEHLCVVCDDEKKQIILLPCKHMCLCKTCSVRCLFNTIKDCPMCRTEIKDSMEVFW